MRARVRTHSVYPWHGRTGRSGRHSELGRPRTAVHACPYVPPWLAVWIRTYGCEQCTWTTSGRCGEGHATKVEQLSDLRMSILDLQEWTTGKLADRGWESHKCRHEPPASLARGRRRRGWTFVLVLRSGL
jgi:hypothetical protein